MNMYQPSHSGTLSERGYGDCRGVEGPGGRWVRPALVSGFTFALDFEVGPFRYYATTAYSFLVASGRPTGGWGRGGEGGASEGSDVESRTNPLPPSMVPRTGVFGRGWETGSRTTPRTGDERGDDRTQGTLSPPQRSS